MFHSVGTQAAQTQRLLLRRFTYADGDAMLKYWAADEKIQAM